MSRAVATMISFRLVTVTRNSDVGNYFFVQNRENNSVFNTATYWMRHVSSGDYHYYYYIVINFCQTVCCDAKEYSVFSQGIVII